jgi:hypothetical protein
MEWEIKSLWAPAKNATSERHAPSWRWVVAAALVAVALEASGWGMLPAKAWLVASHEFFHALAGWLTGASVESIQAESMQGVTFTRGGWYPVISCAGYLGSGLFGALCLRYCARPAMRWGMQGFCACLAFALIIKGGYSGGYAFGMIQALVVDALVFWTARRAWAPFALALCGCLFLSLGFDDVKVLLFYATAETDAGLLARHFGMLFLAWPIALAYASAMAGFWWWAVKGLARDAKLGL